jgi:nucleotide-binding universal stress UspA family protein
MIVLKNVLVPTDFDKASDLALDYGRHFARQFGARLHLLHVVENVVSMAGAEVPLAAVAEVESALEQAGRTRMAQIITDDDRRSFEVVPVVHGALSVAGDIVEYARTNAIDLVVMGTHGRGPLGHLLMGSVAERVVRSAPCPVLTVRPTEREFVQPDAMTAVGRA